MEIEVRQPKASTQLARRSPFSMSASEIVPLLAKLGVRRQAKLSTEDYLVLAEDIEKFDERDIKLGLEDLAKYPRREGETAFPELPRIKQAIVERKLTREAKEIRDQEAEQARYRAEHPEEFCTLAEVLQEWEATRKPSKRDEEREQSIARNRAICEKFKAQLSPEEKAQVEAFKANAPQPSSEEGVA